MSSLATLGGILTLALNVFVIPVAAFYFLFLRDFSRMREAFPTFLPVTYRRWVMDKLAEIDALLSSFVHGQLMVALILMSLYSIGLTIVGTPSGVVLGILTGAASIVPFMGVVVGFLPATLLTLLRYHDWQRPVGVVAVFTVVQLIEGNFVTPKDVGERLGLHPVVVLLAVLVGGEIFGFLSILLAVPATAVIKVFWRDVLDFYRASDRETVGGSAHEGLYGAGQPREFRQGQSLTPPSGGDAGVFQGLTQGGRVDRLELMPQHIDEHLAALREGGTDDAEEQGFVRHRHGRDRAWDQLHHR